jgi:NAD-reducing hydrogenase small subunit
MANGSKIKVATATLAGCFGCHMSLLDIDERILELVDLVDFDRSPITDIKTVGRCDIGLIEGGVANAENLHVAKEFRKNCKILISVGECAIMGGVPSMRNGIPLRECLVEAYLNGPTVVDGVIPYDPDIPTLLDKVYPLQEVVDVDYHLPGCPPSADAIWETLKALLEGKDGLTLPYGLVKYGKDTLCLPNSLIKYD